MIPKVKKHTCIISGVKTIILKMYMDQRKCFENTLAIPKNIHDSFYKKWYKFGEGNGIHILEVR